MMHLMRPNRAEQTQHTKENVALIVAFQFIL